MSDIATTTPTMSSMELVDMINSDREKGKARLAHSDFLKKIEKVLGEDAGKFSSIYLDSMNREKPCYRLPKREASLMVMSESYAVQAKVYDRMTELEKAVVDPLAALPPEHRALVALMIESAEIKKKQAEQEAVQSAHAESIKRIEARQTAIEEGAAYFTVIGYTKLHDIKISLADAAAIGRRAASISKKTGVAVDKVRDPRFGEVGSYHESVLKQALAEMLGGT